MNQFIEGLYQLNFVRVYVEIAAQTFIDLLQFASACVSVNGARVSLTHVIAFSSMECVNGQRQCQFVCVNGIFKAFDETEIRKKTIGCALGCDQLIFHFELIGPIAVRHML